MIDLCVSGFQSGADIGAIKAAHAAGIKTAGWMPAGFKTEYGPRPEYAELYGAMEHESPDFPPRTAANVELADVTIWFGPGDSAGYWCTRKAAERLGKPFWEVATNPSSIQTPADLVLFLKRDGVRSVNCAGSRASKAPDLQGRVERFLGRVFRALREGGDASVGTEGVGRISARGAGMPAGSRR